MKNSEANRKSNRQPDKKPQHWLYKVVRIILVPWSKVTFKLNCKIAPEIANCEGGLVLVAHHVSNLDALWTMIAFRKRHIRFVVGNFLLRTKSAPLFRAIGVIGKEQFVSDIGAVRELIQVARQGHTVMFYPEGQRSADGRLCPIDISVAKLLKKIGVQVGVVRYIGGYLAWPRWAKFWRQGPVTVEIKPFLSPEEMAKRTPEQLYEELLEAMHFDDYQMQLEKAETEEKAHHYGKRDLAAGLSGLLHLCPYCQTPFALTERGVALKCSVCGEKIELKPTGLYAVPITVEDGSVLRNPRDHHDWQLRHHSSFAQPLQFRADIEFASQKKVVPAGRATVAVADSIVRLEFDEPYVADNQEYKIIENVISRPEMMFIEHGDYFQIYVDTHMFRIHPDDGALVIAVADLLRNMVNSQGKN